MEPGDHRSSHVMVANLAALLLILLALCPGCARGEPAGTYWPAGEWNTSTPEAQDMDSAMLQEMMDVIVEQDYAYDAVLVVRHGTVVFEAYRNGYDRNKRHHLQSATKSISSMLIGIAIQEGFLDGVDQKVVDLVSGYDIANVDARKQRLTLEHLLTMSDGIDWHELDYPYSDARNTLGQMWISRDAVQHVLDQPMAREPGEAWVYNSGTSILLGGILEQATGQDVLTFAREYLFDPLGIQDVEWHKAPGNHYHTDGGLYLTPRDMARLGYLMLHGGTWDGREIVSPDWVARSTEARYKTDAGKGYGYQWWTLDGGIYAAHGHYEQLIYVVPEADMVVVFTGQIPDDVLAPTDGLLYRYILAACTDLEDGASHTYAGSGFAFEYPAGFHMTEMALPGADTAAVDAGMVQFRFDFYPFELVQATWMPAQPGIDLNAYLAALADAAAESTGVVYSPGESRSETKDEHRAVFQSLELKVDGLELRGAALAWQCSQSKRIYILSYATNPDVPDEVLSARFQEHVDSFQCHTDE